MIIGSFLTLEIGKVIYDEFGYITRKQEDGSIKRNFGMPFLVIRQATYEEWLQQQLEKDPNFKPKQKSYTANFYEIHVD